MKNCRLITDPEGSSFLGCWCFCSAAMCVIFRGGYNIKNNCRIVYPNASGHRQMPREESKNRVILM